MLRFNVLILLESAIRRSTRIGADELTSSLAEIPGTSEASINGDDSSDFPDVLMIGQYSAQKKAKAAAGRDSLSSVATSNDYNESSGYSTPATSAAPTPANPDPPKSTTASKRRGRRTAAASTMQSTTPSVNAVARAAALRNSKLSLNPIVSKRKSNVLSDDEDDENTADAQLARALQEQEDAAANTMTGSVESYSARRTTRTSQKILPMSDYIFSDDELEAVISSSRPAKKPKIELGPLGTNEVKFTTGRKTSKRLVINDSEDMDIDNSDDFLEIDDSEDSDAPIAMSTPRCRVMKTSTFKIEKTSPKFKIPARPAKASTSAFRPKSSSKPALKKEDTKASASSGLLSSASSILDSEFDSDLEDWDALETSELDSSDDDDLSAALAGSLPAARVPRSRRNALQRINLLEDRHSRRGRQERERLEKHHPELHTMWKDLENLPKIGDVKIEQPSNINRELKPFQLEGVAWMRAMETTDWGGGLLGDEMGMGKTIQAVSLIMSDFPAEQPSLVLIPPVALMQWQQEIKDYTDGTLKTFVYHGTNAQTKDVTLKELRKHDVILMSYNSLESMYRKQEKGFKRKNGIHKEKSMIHQIQFHRVILDEAHNIKVKLLISWCVSC
jgi:DNA repair protein RAD16